MPWQVYNSAGQLLQATDLVDGTVTASKLDTNAVTNAKVADDAIGVVELSATGTASSSTFLRGDNAWAAPGGGPSQAVQSAIEAETNEDTYVPPDLMKHHPGVAKVTCLYEQAGAHGIHGSYNMTSVSDGGAAGDSDHLFNVDFSDDNWQIAGCVENGGIFNQGVRVSTGAGFNAITRNTSNSGTDYSSPGAAYSVFGDQ